MKKWKFHKGLSAQETQNKCRQLFTENYIEDKESNRIIIKTKDGFEVLFGKYQFDHAFSYENTGLLIREFSYQRARRILWIKEAIEQHRGFKRLDERKRRTYFHRKERYVVILKRTKQGFSFATHYVLGNESKFQEMCDKFQ